MVSPKPVRKESDDEACSPDQEVEPCPCTGHNDWDDVRTRKGFKVLRCRVCQQKWKLPSNRVPRCMPFLHDCCPHGEKCKDLHVRRKKSTISERYEQFGDAVLEGVSSDIAKKVTATVRPAAAEPSEEERTIKETVLEDDDDDLVYEAEQAVANGRALSMPAVQWDFTSLNMACCDQDLFDTRKAATLPTGGLPTCDDLQAALQELEQEGEGGLTDQILESLTFMNH